MTQKELQYTSRRISEQVEKAQLCHTHDFCEAGKRPAATWLLTYHALAGAAGSNIPHVYAMCDECFAGEVLSDPDAELILRDDVATLVRIGEARS